MSIQHDATNQEFTTTRDGHTAELAYTRPSDDIIDVTHTFVDEALRGQGLADELARAALGRALAHGAAQHIEHLVVARAVARPGRHTCTVSEVGLE